jgi:polysaccharide biosynthesis/export protein
MHTAVVMGPRLAPLLLVCSLSACGGGDLPRLPETISGPYLLGPGDQVRIITVGQDELTGEFRVDDSGKIAVPMLGNLPAAGLAPASLGQEVATALERNGLLRTPSVSVEVTLYRPISVLGEVNKPGEFAYHPGMTMLAAVALAGGFTPRAVEDTASVLREDSSHPSRWRATQASRLQPGDVVTIAERRF